MLVVQCAKADVEPVADLSNPCEACVFGNVHGVTTKSVVIDETTHFRRQEKKRGMSCVPSRTMSKRQFLSSLNRSCSLKLHLLVPLG